MSYQNLAVHTLYSSMMHFWYPLDCRLWCPYHLGSQYDTRLLVIVFIILAMCKNLAQIENVSQNIVHAEIKCPHDHLAYLFSYQSYHSRALLLQLTFLPQEPQGHLGDLGPGLSSTCPLNNSLIRRWWFFIVGLKVLFRYLTLEEWYNQ
jgi:hypothetical protein